MKKLVINYDLNHVTGSCYVTPSLNQLMVCDCPRTWDPVEGPGPCIHFPELLSQGQAVTDLGESAIDYVDMPCTKVRTENGTVGWIKDVFVRKR